MDREFTDDEDDRVRQVQMEMLEADLNEFDEDESVITAKKQRAIEKLRALNNDIEIMTDDEISSLTFSAALDIFRYRSRAFETDDTLRIRADQTSIDRIATRAGMKEVGAPSEIMEKVLAAPIDVEEIYQSLILHREKVRAELGVIL